MQTWSHCAFCCILILTLKGKAYLIPEIQTSQQIKEALVKFRVLKTKELPMTKEFVTVIGGDVKDKFNLIRKVPTQLNQIGTPSGEEKDVPSREEKEKIPDGDKLNGTNEDEINGEQIPDGEKLNGANEDEILTLESRTSSIKHLPIVPLGLEEEEEPEQQEETELANIELTDEQRNESESETQAN
jgi:hypothetical protein